MDKLTSITSTKNIYKRELYLKKMRGFYNDCEMIKVITGIRRCGKSCIMLSIIDDLIQDGVKQDQIIYIDLDSRINIKINTLDMLAELIDSKTSDNQQTKYLFIDEIQNVPGFEKVINAYRQSGQYSIFITGSNSYLLSSEITTKLTGRYLSFEIFTLNFYEYLEMKKAFKISISDNRSEFELFLQNGGFPACVFYPNQNDKERYLENILNEIYEKDIRRRVRINNTALFNNIRDYMINNAGAPTNISNIRRAFAKNGIMIKDTTISRYIQILIDAKILYECKNFDLKSKKSLNGPAKYYLADVSFYSLTNPNKTNPYGQMLENITYLYAKSNDYKVNVGKIRNLECDFIFNKSNREYSYVQVAMTILANESTAKREFRALEAIKDNYPKYILTMDTLLNQYNGIKHCNIADFMAKNLEFD